MNGDATARSTFQKLATLLAARSRQLRASPSPSPGATAKCRVVWLAEGLVEYLKAKQFQALLQGETLLRRTQPSLTATRSFLTVYFFA